MGGITEIANSYPGYDSAIPVEAASVAEVLRMSGYSTRALENGTSPLHGNKARQGRSIVGQPGSASIGSTALSAPKLPSGSPPCMTKPHQFRLTPVDPTTTSPKTLPTEQSSGLNGSGRRLLTVPGSVISQPPPFTPRIMRQLTGSIGSPGNSMRAGMRCVTPFTNVNSNSGDSSDTANTTRPDQIPAWDDYPERYRPVATRLMECFAGFLAHTDHHIGRVIDAAAT